MVHWHTECCCDKNMICKLVLEEEKNRLKEDQPLVLNPWQKGSKADKDWWGCEKKSIEKTDMKNYKTCFIQMAHLAHKPDASY